MVFVYTANSAVLAYPKTQIEAIIWLWCFGYVSLSWEFPFDSLYRVFGLGFSNIRLKSCWAHFDLLSDLLTVLLLNVASTGKWLKIWALWPGIWDVKLKSRRVSWFSKSWISNCLFPWAISISSIQYLIEFVLPCILVSNLWNNLCCAIGTDSGPSLNNCFAFSITFLLCIHL